MNIRIALPILLLVFCFKTFAADYTPTECPVVGNTKSKIYHIPGKKSYAKMLRQNKAGDNRKCFKTENEASEAGFRKAQR